MTGKEYHTCQKILSVIKELKIQILITIECRVKKDAQKGLVLLWQACDSGGQALETITFIFRMTKLACLPESARGLFIVTKLIISRLGPVSRVIFLMCGSDYNQQGLGSMKHACEPC